MTMVYLNGAFIPAAEARVSIYDGGFLHGAGLFETMRADHGRIFRIDAHLDRLLASAEKLGLPIERPDLPLSKDFDELLERNELKSARVRMTVTAGSLYPGDESTPLTVCVTAAALPPYPPEMLAKGISVMITTFTQSTTDPLAGHKTTNYLPRLLALRHAQRFHCMEAFWFTPENYLAEGCISNVFVVRGGAAATPPLNTPVLPGIARAVVIGLAGELGIDVQERRLDINDVLDADEIFVTNSSMQVMPVCRVEKKDIGAGKPGPVTARLREAFLARVERECGGGPSGRQGATE